MKKSKAKAETFLSERIALHCGDCLSVLAKLGADSIDSVVTDPPYHLTSIVKRFGADGAKPAISQSQRRWAKSGANLGGMLPDGSFKPDQYGRLSKGFMGKRWDGGDVAFQVELWQQIFRVLKPGGHVAAFGGTRTYHRIACAIEDAGFEIRDQLAWAYGSGFPKSHDVSKGIDRALGAERAKVRIDASQVRNPKTTGGGKDGMEGATRPFIESAKARGFHEAVSDEAVSDEAVSWQGWGTALKPAWEPICLARKPLAGTVAANVLAHGTGALNIAGCRVGTEKREYNGGMGRFNDAARAHGYRPYANGVPSHTDQTFSAEGRWPANIVHDGSAEVVRRFPDTAPAQAGQPRSGQNGDGWGMTATGAEYDDDGGSAARFFYTAKADSDDRLGSKHPTVKPVDLMQWLTRLITPKGGLVLDPFAGTGTTGEAAWREGFRAVLVERETEYQEDIRRRMALCLAGPDERAREAIKAKLKGKPVDAGPLFGGTG